MSTRRRVSIVGWGCVTPHGIGVDKLWSGTRSGSADVELMTLSYPDRQWAVPVARCPSVDDRFAHHERRRLDRLHLLALAAVEDALVDANARRSGPAADRVAVVAGLGFCALGFLEAQHKLALTTPAKVNPLAIPVTMTNSVATHVAMRIGATGPCQTIATACASGADAVGIARLLLLSGQADRVVVVGADAMLTHGALTFFQRMRALSPVVEDLRTASRPFASSRAGFVAAEGAAALVIECDVENHESRSEVLGYGASCDAQHLTAPDPSGSGIDRAVIAALRDADLDASELASINAHGTSTTLNDELEAQAFERLYHERTPATATKSTTGHMIGGSGIAELIVSALSASTGIVPATATTGALISERIATAERQVSPGPVISHSLGFGGQNAAVVVGAHGG